MPEKDLYKKTAPSKSSKRQKYQKATPKKAKTQTITVKVDEGNAPDLEVLATNICDLADVFRMIDDSRLKRHTLLVLLKSSTGLPHSTINRVLLAAQNLRADFIKDVPKKYPHA